MDIVFIRHGRTKANQKGIYGGHLDIPLSAEGIEEAEQLSKALQHKKFAKIYASPLRRAVQTAQLLGFTPEIDNRLCEMNFGIFEGLTYQDIVTKYPDETEKWNTDYLNYRIPKGESLMDVYNRVSQFLSEIPEEKDPFLIITHEGVIKCALCSILGSPEYFYRFKAEYCRFTQIAITEGYGYIKSLNTTEIY